MNRDSPTPYVIYTRQPQDSTNGHVHFAPDRAANGVAHDQINQSDSRETSTTPIEFHLSTQTPPRLSGDEKRDIITEDKIGSNFSAFRPYIVSCVKVTDLIVYYDYFTDGKFEFGLKCFVLCSQL